MNKRGCGILLHLTSLPSLFGIGDMGPRAYRFADFLCEAGQSYWQILPLNPTELVHQNAPYHSTSAFALNPLLLSPEVLVGEGLLSKADTEVSLDFPRERVDFEAVVLLKKRLLDSAYERFKERGAPEEFHRFCRENSYWLEDYALFVTLKSHFHGAFWCDWPLELRDREPQALDRARQEFQDALQKERFLQYLCLKQWMSLKNYCNQKGIAIIGDVPIYVHFNAACVWSHPELWKLDGAKRPYAVAGVPPDYFSPTGQLWGHSIYRWDVLKERGYDWWVSRMQYSIALFDWLRIDHFRGLAAYWEVPASESTAVNGRWVEGPRMDFFRRLSERLPRMPFIAEDLGMITPDVRELIEQLGFPGMRLLLFAFGGDLPWNPFAPHNHVQNCVVYTGTHDNNTARGWFEKEAPPEDKARLASYLGREVTAENVHRELIHLAMMSVANTTILPMQDILGLGQEARMNLPAQPVGNWEWRLDPEALTPDVVRWLREMATVYHRI